MDWSENDVDTNVDQIYWTNNSLIFYFTISKMYQFGNNKHCPFLFIDLCKSDQQWSGK